VGVAVRTAGFAVRFTARFAVMLSQSLTARFNSAIFTFVVSVAFVFFAIAAGLACVAVVLNFGVSVGFLLTDNWETGAAAAWNIDGTTGGSSSSA